MACYLCAYLGSQSPRFSQPLPTGSPASATEPLGICNKCNVLACSRHGTRYSWFECAICTPARAAMAAITGAGSGDPAAALAHRIGSQAPAVVQQAADLALERLAADHRRQPADRQLRYLQPGDEPNLISNLAEAIRRASTVRRGERAMVAEPEPTVSYDAIGAAVRQQLTGQPVLPASEFSRTVLAGALLSAYQLADEPTDRALADEPTGSDRAEDAPADRAGGASLTELPPPWLVSHPPLLDPILWMVGTAYHLGRPAGAEGF